MDMSYIGTLALDWCIRCFGDKVAYSKRERAIRIVEEAIELAQAVGVEKAEIDKLNEVVFARDHGDIGQELRGIFITWIVFCAAQNHWPERVAENELRRILALDKSKFEKRQAEKEKLGVVLT